MPVLEMSLTIEKNLDKPTMRTVFKGDKAEIAYSFAEVIVTRFADSFGFSNKLNKVQIEILTTDALDKFAYESLEDMILFFKYCRSGRYGDTSRGIDSNLIFGRWFPIFMEEKSIAREKINESKKSELKSNSVSIEDLKTAYEKKISAKKQRENQLQYIDKITSTMDRQMLEDTIVTWEKDEKTKPYVKYLKAKRRTIK